MADRASALVPPPSQPYCRFPVLVVFCAALLALATWLFALPRATVTTYIPQDVWGFFDFIHRLDIGHLPHVDFHSPLGGLVFALPFFGFRVTGQLAGSLEIANVAMLTVALPIAAVLLYRRTTTGIAVVFLIALAGVVAIPWAAAESGLFVTHSMFYNRWGWGLVATLFLAALPLAPPIRGGTWTLRIHFVAEALSIGVVLLLLFFIKVTYFLVALSFVVLFGAALARFLRTSLLGLAVFALTLLAVSLATEVVDDYLLDVVRAIDVAHNPDTFRSTPSFARIVETTLPHIALGVLAVGVAGLHRRWAAAQMFYFAFVLASCVALAHQNSQPPFFFALINILIAAAMWCSHGSTHRRLIMVAMCLFLAPTISRQVVASASFHLIARGDFEMFSTDLPRMNNTWFGNRAVNWFAADADESSASAFVWSRRYPAAPTMDLSMGEHLETLRSGVALLRQHGVTSEPVATLDYVNCFPTLLKGAAPRGVIYANHLGRMVNLDMAKRLTFIFGDAVYLMIPKFPLKQDSTAATLDLHREHLASAWRPVAENDHWRLLAKAERAASIGDATEMPP